MFVDKKDVTHHQGEFANLTAEERQYMREILQDELDRRSSEDGPAGPTKPESTVH